MKGRRAVKAHTTQRDTMGRLFTSKVIAPQEAFQSPQHQCSQAGRPPLCVMSRRRWGGSEEKWGWGLGGGAVFDVRLRGRIININADDRSHCGGHDGE